jgi:hypothetical protein
MVYWSSNGQMIAITVSKLIVTTKGGLKMEPERIF